MKTDKYFTDVELAEGEAVLVAQGIMTAEDEAGVLRAAFSDIRACADDDATSASTLKGKLRSLRQLALIIAMREKARGLENFSDALTPVMHVAELFLDAADKAEAATAKSSGKAAKAEAEAEAEAKKAKKAARDADTQSEINFETAVRLAGAAFTASGVMTKKDERGMVQTGIDKVMELKPKDSDLADPNTLEALGERVRALAIIVEVVRKRGEARGETEIPKKMRPLIEVAERLLDEGKMVGFLD